MCDVEGPFLEVKLSPCQLIDFVAPQAQVQCQQENFELLDGFVAAQLGDRQRSQLMRIHTGIITKGTPALADKAGGGERNRFRESNPESREFLSNGRTEQGFRGAKVAVERMLGCDLTQWVRIPLLQISGLEKRHTVGRKLIDPDAANFFMPRLQSALTGIVSGFRPVHFEHPREKRIALAQVSLQLGRGAQAAVFKKFEIVF